MGFELADLYNKCSKQPLQWTGQRELGHVHTTEQQVTVIHEHVILGSAGFWDLLSVDDAVLRSHFFVKVTRPSEVTWHVHFPVQSLMDPLLLDALFRQHHLLRLM